MVATCQVAIPKFNKQISNAETAKRADVSTRRGNSCMIYRLQTVPSVKLRECICLPVIFLFYYLSPSLRQSCVSDVPRGHCHGRAMTRAALRAVVYDVIDTPVRHDIA